MGYIKQSDDIINAGNQLYETIYESKSNNFLQGQGQPILVTYYNINDNESSVENGTETVDNLVGKDSPFRYNKIENFPIYGFHELNIEQNDLEGGLIDLDMELDLTILPNTIRPLPNDYFEYRFKNRPGNLVFRVNNVQLTSLKSNGFYRIFAHMQAINDDGSYTSQIDKYQVVKEFKTDLDRIGTNDRCLINSLLYDKILKYEKVLNELSTDYLDTFYRKSYNALVLYGSIDMDYGTYDPWLTNFVINNHLFDEGKDPIALVNFDQNEDFRRFYNKTLFHAIETRDIGNYKDQRVTPVSFSKTNTNPFAYYGLETVFKLDLYEDDTLSYPRNYYMNLTFINNILRKEENPSYNFIENLIIRYMDESLRLDNLITENDMIDISHYSINHNEFNFRFIPILMVIMKNCIEAMKDSDMNG